MASQRTHGTAQLRTAQLQVMTAQEHRTAQLANGTAQSKAVTNETHMTAQTRTALQLLVVMDQVHDTTAQTPIAQLLVATN